VIVSPVVLSTAMQHRRRPPPRSSVRHLGADAMAAQATIQHDPNWALLPDITHLDQTSTVVARAVARVAVAGEWLRHALAPPLLIDPRRRHRPIERKKR
jgi:hypothetical protein